METTSELSLSNFQRYLIVLQVITGQVCFFSQSIIYGLKIALLHHIKGLQHTGACT